MTRKILTYTELSQLPTFEERFEYLKLGGRVGDSTFGYDRWINQQFYKGKEWRLVRDKVIARDMGYDLGLQDENHKLTGRIIVHHMCPMMIEDIEESTDIILNPEYLISTCDLTHKAIHYGSFDLLPKPYIERTKWDTCPWRGVNNGRS